jgi:predicted nucleic acid-binding Zn ribbon protein
VTAAGFQLKGSGWYETDFKSGSACATPSAEGGACAACPAVASTPAAAT